MESLNHADHAEADALHELLNEHAFPTLFDARSAVEAWRFDYNHVRPHTALDGLTPIEFIGQTSNHPNSRLAVA